MLVGILIGAIVGAGSMWALLYLRSRALEASD